MLYPQQTKTKICLKIVSEYDQEIPQSQTADNRKVNSFHNIGKANNTIENRFRVDSDSY